MPNQLLDPLFSNVTCLDPGEEIEVINGSIVKIRVTVGPVLGPPWQRSENSFYQISLWFLGKDAVQLAELLNARFIVPTKNGDLDAKGFLASIIQAEGKIESFKESDLCFYRFWDGWIVLIVALAILLLASALLQNLCLLRRAKHAYTQSSITQ